MNEYNNLYNNEYEYITMNDTYHLCKPQWAWCRTRTHTQQRIQHYHTFTTLYPHDFL